MKRVFADTCYWIAITRPNDPLKTAANEARKRLGICKLITTEEVLTEYLTALSKRRFRKTATEIVRQILESDDVEVVRQSHVSFLRGLERYTQREDKEYSLPDCISMNVMDEQGITDVLTEDHHFEQEGKYTVLMKKPSS